MVVILGLESFDPLLFRRCCWYPETCGESCFQPIQKRSEERLMHNRALLFCGMDMEWLHGMYMFDGVD